MRILITLLSILFFAPFTSSAVYARDNFSGNISINRGECTTYDCEYLITFESSETSSQAFEPRIEWLILDCDSNTVKETRTYFDTIYPGKKQKKELTVFFREMFEPGDQVKFTVGEAKSGMEYVGTGIPFPLFLNRYTFSFCSQ